MPIKIKASILKQLDRNKPPEFKDVEEYANHILAREAHKFRQNPEEEEEIKKRLIRMGYL